MAEDGRPEFFKVYMPEFSAERMDIPRLFKDYMGGAESGPVTLIGPGREVWRVRFENNEDGLCFTEGWKEFVKDNEVDTGDFLVFEYDEERKFRVAIYDHTSCEKEAAFRAKCSQGLGEDGERVQKQIKQEESLEMSGKFCPLKRKQSGKKGLLIQEETELAEVAKSFRSAKPYFVIMLKSYHFKANMRIPISFLSEHDLEYEKNEKMILRNDKNQCWSVNIVWNGGTWHLSAGWSQFLQDNKLKEGDILVFELLSRLEMQIHHWQKDPSFSATIFQMQPHGSEKQTERAEALSFSARIFPANAEMRRPYMNIPKNFSDRAMLRKGSHVKLRDPSGRLFPARIARRTNKASLFMSNGWQHFFKSNILKVGDACEFMSLGGSGTSSDPLIIDVKINP